MTCERVTFHNGGHAIVCTSTRSRREKCGCGHRATLLCDWKLPEDQRVSGRISATCDAPLCPRCTTSPAPEKDLCPRHAREWAARQARQSSRPKEPPHA